MEAQQEEDNSGLPIVSFMLRLLIGKDEAIDKVVDYWAVCKWPKDVQMQPSAPWGEWAVQDGCPGRHGAHPLYEGRLGECEGGQDSVILWLIEHAVFVLNKFSVRHAGATLCTRLTGSMRRWLIVEIGEMLLAKLALRRRQQVAHQVTEAQARTPVLL